MIGVSPVLLDAYESVRGLAKGIVLKLTRILKGGSAEIGHV